MSEIRRAVLKSYDAAAHKADVQIAGSLAVWLDAVRVATNIPAADVLAGRQCSVLFLDPSNQDDAVVLTIQGALPSIPSGATVAASATVIGETTFGQAAAAGSASPYSRGDHTHGTPADPVPTHTAASDPHSPYALLAGRAGGQTLIGGTAASQNLTLQSTSHSTKGVILTADPIRLNIATDGIQDSGGSTIFMNDGNATMLGGGFATVGVDIYDDISGGTKIAEYRSALITLAVSQQLPSLGLMDAAPVNARAISVGVSTSAYTTIMAGTFDYTGTGPIASGISYAIKYSATGAGAGNVTGSQIIVQVNSAKTITNIFGERYIVQTLPGQTGAITNIKVYSGVATYIGSKPTNATWLEIPNIGHASIATVAALDILAQTAGSSATYNIRQRGATGVNRLAAPTLIGADASPVASALLELKSTTGALLLPRMTTTQRNALTAVNGMLIYNTTTNVVEAYENGAWVNV